jgi:hypothetical protein
MRTRTPTERQSPRVILETPLPAKLDEADCLLVEIGLGGAKIEHAERIPVGQQCRFELDGIVYQAVARHAVLLPAKEGVAFHTGVEFVEAGQEHRDALHRLLIREAEQQVRAWEANLAGRSTLQRTERRRSVVAQRFVWLRWVEGEWLTTVTSDPNQPLDGIAVAADTPQDEIRKLCRTYEASDDAMRDVLRQIATLAILERLHE